MHKKKPIPSDTYKYMKELPILNVHDNLKTKLHRLSNGILSRLILIKNNMSVILWRSVSLVKETGVPGENRPRWCM